jgi:hypothetical protein
VLYRLHLHLQLVDYSTYRLTGPGLSSLARLSPDGRISIDLSLAHALPSLPEGYANDVKEDGVEVQLPKSRTKGKSGIGIALNVVIRSSSLFPSFLFHHPLPFPLDLTALWIQADMD